MNCKLENSSGECRKVPEKCPHEMDDYDLYNEVDHEDGKGDHDRDQRDDR
jgi:hypothetical protein